MCTRPRLRLRPGRSLRLSGALPRERYTQINDVAAAFLGIRMSNRLEIGRFICTDRWIDRNACVQLVVNIYNTLLQAKLE